MVRPKIPDLEPKVRSEAIAARATKLTDPDLTDEQRLKAIDDTSKQLEELRFKGARRRMVGTLQDLSAQGFVKEAVLNAVDLRNSRAGHASPQPVTDDQVTMARHAAAKLLMLYFNAQWGAGPSGTPAQAAEQEA